MQAGLITATPGSWTDYDQVERDIAEDRAKYRIVKVAFDPANAGQIAGHLQADGVELVEFRQNHFTYNEPMQEWEKAGRGPAAGPQRRQGFTLDDGATS